MSKTRLKTALRTVGAVALSGLVLSGCGSASPGVAVEVGDETISTRTVDEAPRRTCARRSATSSRQRHRWCRWASSARASSS